jgi:hypothetical protein
LLQPRDRNPTTIAEAAGEILSARIHTSRIRRWGRLRLPNGQVARSLWCEDRHASKIRVTRNVKVCLTVSVLYSSFPSLIAQLPTDRIERRN